MSERVTWEACPRCGCLAAVGWARIPGTGSAQRNCRPVEFDCIAGCPVDVDVLAQYYRPMGRNSSGRPSDPAQEP
jgi:hypothetical protein